MLPYRLNPPGMVWRPAPDNPRAEACLRRGDPAESAQALTNAFCGPGVIHAADRSVELRCTFSGPNRFCPRGAYLETGAAHWYRYGIWNAGTDPADEVAHLWMPVTVKACGRAAAERDLRLTGAWNDGGGCVRVLAERLAAVTGWHERHPLARPAHWRLPVTAELHDWNRRRPRPPVPSRHPGEECFWLDVDGTPGAGIELRRGRPREGTE